MEILFYFCRGKTTLDMTKVFKRKIYNSLLKWKSESSGRTALLIEGARRVGKSTIVQEFARNEYDSYLLIDFSSASQDVRAMFDDLSDLNYLFLRLQASYNVVLHERRSVVVFDEVQFCPKARQAIKHLVADGRYDYIETGSLVSIRKNVKDILIPSEEEHIAMLPMDYEEFRWAVGDEATMPLLRQIYDKGMPLGTGIRQEMRKLRLYMLVGGMPQAVSEYIETNNMQRVDTVKRNIIRLYQEDFRKLDPTGRLGQLFMQIPAQLNSNSGRYKPYQILDGVSESRVAELMQDMYESKTVNVSWHANDPNIGMPLSQDLSRYKVYCGDTGLFVTLAFWDNDITENEIYQKLLSDKLSANLGYVFENLVAQMLTASGNKLFYYTWPKDDKRNYEVDFLLSRRNKICPIEVKSSGYNTHASLDAFCHKFSSRVGSRYLVYTKDLRKDGETTLLPVYMVPFI